MDNRKVSRITVEVLGKGDWYQEENIVYFLVDKRYQAGICGLRAIVG